MLNFIKKIFDYNERQIKRLRAKVEEINKLEDKARKLKDEEFRKETLRLKEKINSDEKKLDENLPWAYAVVREASRRMLGQRHFDVQLMASIALHEGKIAEQKTGEGKTLSAVPALYLNALLGKGVHLVTVNDYLARRDAGWMGKIFYFLGLSTASIISDQSFIYDPNYKNSDAGDWRLAHLRPITRKEAYQADITYGINSEFGFDYLKDNMTLRIDEIVQRNFYYAIIDEADSVLIDEARTPHIISAPYEEDISKYYKYSKIVESFEEKEDYTIDEKLRTANFTERGIQKLEKILGVTNLFEKDYDTLFHLEAALKAKTLFKKDKDYIVKDNEVIIVDEFTGRLLFGRRFSEGIHQAIEAKENVPIKQESKTLATVSLQNYFRMYKKLAGMTGTAATEAEEFNKIYKTEVVVIPTHRPMIRKDRPDVIYKTKKGKYDAVVEEIIKNYKIGRPVLVGTTSIENNEYLSSLLKRRGVPHEVLNAKNHEKEASIIAKAGEKGSITIATNMAGRGVDIILGGEIKDKKQIKEWQKKHNEVVSLGGLLVIGTERHESRRIDNQLRGRSGRQGDPGETVFFVSLEDDLMRIFGGEQITKLMNFFNFPEDQPLSHPMVSKAIEQSQIKVEGFNFDIRKHLVDYDDVLNKQREIIYSLRKKILFGFRNKDFYEIILKMFEEEIRNIFNLYLSDSSDYILRKQNIEKLRKEISEIIEVSEKEISSDNFFEIIKEKIMKEFKKREKKLGKNLWEEIVKLIVISIIDRYWVDHLTGIENLREGINLRAYAQIDPLVAYKNEAFSMFERLMFSINSEVSRKLLKVDFSVENIPFYQESARPSEMIFSSASALNPFRETQNVTQSPKVILDRQEKPQFKHKKLGRNDPCWCGSGKKYKKCHYPN